MSRASHFLALTLLVGCAKPASKDVPSQTHTLEGSAVTLDGRGAKLNSTNELVWDGVARNDEKKALIGLAIDLTLKRADGSVIQTVEVAPVSSRERVNVLEPGYSVPIHLQQKLDEAPSSIDATIVSAEVFAEVADAPLPIDVKALAGADAAVLELTSLGHFSIGAFSGGKGLSPFHMSLGVRNQSGAALSRAELSIVFTDDKKKDVDRIPVAREFVPPLRPGDAVIEAVTGDAHPYAGFFVEVKSLTKAP